MDSDKDDPSNSSPCEGETAGETEKDSSCNELPGGSIAKPKQAEATRSSARPKVLTEKMKDFRLQLTERDFIAAHRACSKQVLRIQSILADEADIPALQQERGKLETRMEDFTNAHTALYDTLENEEERVEQNRRFDDLNRGNQEAFRSLNDKIIATRAPRDDSSSISSSRSKYSRLSKGSNSSSATSILRKAKMAAKAARLEAELKFLDEENERKASLKKQEDEVKKIKMLKKLAATQAELEAVNKVEEQHFGVVNHTEEGTLPKDNCSDEHLENYLQAQVNSILHPPATSSVIPPGTEIALNAFPASVPNTIAQTSVTFTNGSSPTPLVHMSPIQEPSQRPQPSKLNPSASPFTGITPAFAPSRRPIPDEQLNPSEPDTPVPFTSTGEDLMQRLADLLAQRQDRDSLPRPEPEVFNGNPLCYPHWIKSFEALIERKTKDPSERLYYLSKYTKGEAKEAVSGLLSLDSVNAYNKAKRILASRFGNHFIVADAFRKRINDWPKIQPNDGPGLRKFSDFLEHCNTAMTTIHYLNVLNDPDENQKIIKKLPTNIVARWSRVVDEWIAEVEPEEYSTPQLTKKQLKAEYPPFSEFCKFMSKEARIACNPVTSPQALKIEESKTRFDPGRAKLNPSDRRNFGARILATGSSEEKEKGSHVINSISSSAKRTVCPLCKDSHELDLCEKFTKMAISERKKFAHSNALCWGCLKWGHLYKDCRGRKTCRICNRRHPTSLHDTSITCQERAPNPESSESIQRNPISHCVEVCATNSCAEPVSHSLIVPVWVHHADNQDNKIMVYALLDDQSDACFIKQTAVEKLGVSGPEVHLKLSTVLAQEMISSRKITGLVVRGVYESAEIPLPRTYTRDIIPARSSQIPRPETARKWPHLKKVADHLMPYNDQLDVSLLLGINCARAIKPREIIPGDDDDPYAKKTALGWGVIGMVTPNSSEHEEEQLGVNRIIAREVQFSPKKVCHFALKSHTKEIVSPAQVKRMFELDFSEAQTEDSPLSYEDKKFMSKVSEGIHQRPDGHYEMPLPLKQDLLTLPDNKEVALKRLSKLKKRLKTDSKYRQDYLAFMSDVISQGHAEKVPPDEISLKNGQVWYIPHHGVYHPKKPDKMRVVFDCSVEFAGECLNRHLLQGPDLTNNLVGVLCRFRQEQAAVMCDVQGMFHQVSVNPEHRNFLRFLWWDNGNFDAQPTEYRMTVHLFGATSSPGCANFALKKVASDYEEQCGSEAAKFVKKNFYVDDGLKSVSSPELAISLMKNSTKLCKMGGFKLHKFISNCKAVIDAVPKEDRSKDLQSLDLTKDTLPVERALGVQWCVESDTLQFRVEMKDQPLTRRGILSTVSSVFDPLGMLAPLVLLGKNILQELCRDGADWDDQIPELLRMKWERWRNDLHLLSSLKIPRCYKPEEF